MMQIGLNINGDIDDCLWNAALYQVKDQALINMNENKNQTWDFDTIPGQHFIGLSIQ